MTDRVPPCLGYFDETAACASFSVMNCLDDATFGQGGAASEHHVLRGTFAGAHNFRVAQSFRLAARAIRRKAPPLRSTRGRLNEPRLILNQCSLRAVTTSSVDPQKAESSRQRARQDSNLRPAT